MWFYLGFLSELTKQELNPPAAHNKTKRDEKGAELHKLVLVAKRVAGGLSMNKLLGKHEQCFSQNTDKTQLLMPFCTVWMGGLVKWPRQKTP